MLYTYKILLYPKKKKKNTFFIIIAVSLLWNLRQTALHLFVLRFVGLEERKKCEDKKYFNFSFFLFGWKWKREEIEKVSLYKYMYIPLLKNDAQLK